MKPSDLIVILGTAHLITTPGKRSPDGEFREAVYSRDIVGRVKAQLEARGFRVFVDYEPLEPNGAMRAASSKEEANKELAYRVNQVNQMCKQFGSRKCIYVSIHVNAAGSGGKWLTAGGWCCYTSVGQTRGDKLADCMYDAAKRLLTRYEAQLLAGKGTGEYDRFQRAIRTDTSDGDPDMEANFYVLRNTACAACLSENLFQDNRSDVAFLTSEEGKDTIVAIHVEAIEQYCKEAQV